LDGTLNDRRRASSPAVETLRFELNELARRSVKALDEASRAGAAAAARVAGEVALRRQTLRDAERVLAECLASEGADCTGARRSRDRAQVRLDLALRIARETQLARDRFGSSRLRLTDEFDTCRRLGTSRLRDIALDIADYRSIAGGGGPATTGFRSIAPKMAPELTHAPGLPPGFALVPLTAIDTSQSAVHGLSDFSKGYSPDDLEWAFDAFDQVILPGLAAGISTDAFRDRDARSGLMGTRSYSMTYSQFLNSGDSIRLEPAGNGLYRVINGQHRIWVAQRAGRTSVPARVMP
jgi:hypothetical protein